MNHPLNESDKKFCARLYADLYPLLLKRALSLLHDEDTARDIVQDTFVSLFGKTAKLREMTLGEQAAYAVTAVKNNAFKYLKKYQSSDALVVIGHDANAAENMEGAFDDPLDEVMRIVSQADLLKILDENLTEKERRILTLTYLNNLSDRESAAQMGIKYATFRKDKSRAKAKLLKVMRRRMQ